MEIVASVDDSDKSREMLELLADIASVSDLIKVDVRRDDAQMKPSFALRQPGAEPRVRFAGLPMGHEFTSLVLALLQTGGYPPKVDAAVIGADPRPGSATITSRPSFHSPARAAPTWFRHLNLMAVLNPKVRHTMIDGAVFQDEVERRQVMAVPAVFLNGQPFGQGRMELARNPRQAGCRFRERARRARLRAKAPFDVLVVGGGPAGAAAAIYAARKGIRTGIAAERLGGQLLDTVGIENFISVKETQGHKLATGLEQHVTTYDVDVMNMQRAEALDSRAI